MKDRAGMQVRNAITVGVIGTMLGACSGSSGSSTSPAEPPVTPPPTRATFEQLALQGRNLFDENIDIPYTVEANLPSSGTATYSGVASFKSVENVPDGLGFPEYDTLIVMNPEIMSELTLTADLGASTIGGKLTNFQSAEFGALSGEVNLSNGTIDRSGPEPFISADVAGAVGTPGNQLAYTGELEGNFVGENAEFAYGYLGLDTDWNDTANGYWGVFNTKK